MFEKVNPSHPDKVADRIAGAIVDLCYTKSRNRWSNESSAKLDLSTAEGRQRWAQANPKVACEVLIGHGECNIQVETSEQISAEDIEAIVRRIAGEGIETRALIVPQDIHLAANQQHGVKCGDNGIFRGVPPTHEQKLLTAIAASIYDRHPFDGKYLISTKADEDLARINREHYEGTLTICQSHATQDDIQRLLMGFDDLNGEDIFGCPEDISRERIKKAWERNHTLTEHRWISAKYEAASDINHFHTAIWDATEGLELEKLKDTRSYELLTTINPLGEWTGGPNTDSGATNRKLGSDMGDGVTGGGLHGKDLSKADVQ